MLVKISKPEAYGLMTKSNFETLDQRVKELENLGIDWVNYHTQFTYDEDTGELFYEVINEEKIVCYRLRFKVKNEVGRPSLGVTKKVSITLPEEDWERLEVLKDFLEIKSTSELMRYIIGLKLDQEI